MFKIEPRLGSSESGVRKCANVVNSTNNFAPRLGSGDSGVRNCATVAKFIINFARRFGSERIRERGGGAGRARVGRMNYFFDHTLNNALVTRATTNNRKATAMQQKSKRKQYISSTKATS